MAQGICEGLWMKIILDDIKVKYEGHIKLFCDNNSVMNITHNPIQYDRTKHIEIDRHFIIKKLDSGLIVRAHVPIGLQVSTWRFSQDSILIMKRTRYAYSKRYCIDLNSLSKHGYKQSQGDHTLFIKHSPNGKLTPLLVYVDDMIVTGDDEIKKLTLKENLATQFEMELRKLKYFFGINVAYYKQGIFISQRKYVLDLLKETRKLGCKTSRNHRIGYEESPTIEKSQYQRLMGKLIYLSHTRSHITYAISVINQFMHDPKESHLQEVERILKYLKASLGKGLEKKVHCPWKYIQMQTMQDQLWIEGPFPNIECFWEEI
ncbi:putative mitochondrial protein, partial [Mucuna pruriens]